MPEPFCKTLEETQNLVGGSPTTLAFGVGGFRIRADGRRRGFQARGGETEGLRRLRTQLSRKEWVGQFEKPNTNPTTLFHGLSEGKPKPKSPFEIAAARGKGRAPVERTRTSS